ncbi:MAG: ribosome maturation factor RimM [Paracoccaceae bacterium]
MSRGAEDEIVVGRLAGAYGVAGQVRIKSFCADPDAIADYLPLAGDGIIIRQLVVEGRAKEALVVRVDAITTREQAEALKGTDLRVPRSRLPGLPDDEFYHADLVGLTVLDAGGAHRGTVRAVFDHGAGDLLEIAVDGGGDTALLPFTRANVPTVDLTAGRIVIDPPEGILDD